MRLHFRIIFGVGLLSGSLLISFLVDLNRLITFLFRIGLAALLWACHLVSGFILSWGVIGIYWVSNLIHGNPIRKVDPAFIRVFSVIGCQH